MVKVALSSADGTLAFPATVKVYAGNREATFSIVASPDASTHGSSIVVTLNGVVNETEFNVVANELASLSLSASSVKGGDSVTGTVVLQSSAPVNTVVALSSSKTNLATVPATVTIPAGSTYATFTVSTGTTSKAKNVKITATKGGKSLKAVVSVKP
ncbi:hypothetical protein BH11ARM2_BH11ARM2_23380 [soil metagenome]